MSDFAAQIEKSQREVAEAQARMAELTGRIETARAKMAAGDAKAASIDIENATLEDVHKHTEVMNANIAELIMGLDDVTAGFSKDFSEMRSKTRWESFVGMFSKGRSEAMRQERMRTASIDDKLQDLIAKSDMITKLLQSQLDELNRQKTKVEANLVETLEEREFTVGAVEGVRAEIAPKDVRQLFICHKALFYRLYRGWSETKKSYVADFLAREYQVDKLGTRARLFGHEAGMEEPAPPPPPPKREDVVARVGPWGAVRREVPQRRDDDDDDRRKARRKERWRD